MSNYNLLKDIDFSLKIKAIMKNGTMNNTDSLNIHSVKNLMLKKYQQIELDRMKLLENNGQLYIDGNKCINTRIGILADKPVSGKSIIILARIIKQPILNIKYEVLHSVSNKLIIYNSLHCVNYIKTNLIIVPYYLIDQWRDYIINYSELTYFIVNNRNCFINLMNNMNKYNIILISHNFYNNFYTKCIHINKPIIFSRIIYDNINNLNIPNSKELKSCFTWYITSNLEDLIHVNNVTYDIQYPFTYDDVISCTNSTYIPYMISYNYLLPLKYNGIKKIFKLLYNNKDCIPIDKIIIKTKDSVIDASYNIIVPKINKYVCNNIDKSLLNDKLVDQLSNNKTTDLINSLSLKVEPSINNVIDIFSNKNIKSRLENIYNDACTICFDSFSDPIICVSCCKNIFHLECLLKYSAIIKEFKCPLCRDIFNINNSTIIYNDYKPKNNICSQITYIKKIIKPGCKYIIVSNNKSKLRTISYTLNTTTFRVARIIYNYRCIRSILTKYKQNKLDILLIYAKTKLLGLDLKETTDIIFCEKLSKSMYNNFLSLSQRLGRDQQLIVHCIYNYLEFNE